MGKRFQQFVTRLGFDEIDCSIVDAIVGLSKTGHGDRHRAAIEAIAGVTYHQLTGVRIQVFQNLNIHLLLGDLTDVIGDPNGQRLCQRATDAIGALIGQANGFRHDLAEIRKLLACADTIPYQFDAADTDSIASTHSYIESGLFKHRTAGYHDVADRRCPVFHNGVSLADGSGIAGLVFYRELIGQHLVTGGGGFPELDRTSVEYRRHDHAVAAQDGGFDTAFIVRDIGFEGERVFFHDLVGRLQQRTVDTVIRDARLNVICLPNDADRLRFRGIAEHIHRAQFDISTGVAIGDGIIAMDHEFRPIVLADQTERTLRRAGLIVLDLIHGLRAVANFRSDFQRLGHIAGDVDYRVDQHHFERVDGQVFTLQQQVAARRNAHGSVQRFDLGAERKWLAITQVGRYQSVDTERCILAAANQLAIDEIAH